MDIAFIIPNIIKGGGGARNIFRAAKHLKTKGHKVTFYCKSNQDVAELKENVSKWFYDLGDCEFIHYSGELERHDVAIATFYETAFSLKYNIDKIKVPFYLVQDYEPLFYPMSTQYVMAESTYRFGFMHICSGLWCKTFLETKFGAWAEYFQFPVDKNVYYSLNNVKRDDKTIIFFAKPEMPRRCYELGISALRKLNKKRPDIKIVLYGSNNLNEAKIPFEAECLGLLPTIEDLANLYRTATLGLVFSTTNPSLVPYEMMLCGCPVCDIDFDFALKKYGDSSDNVFLLDIETEKMSDQLIKIIDNPKERERVSSCAYQWAMKEFPSEWEMGERFEQIITDGIEAYEKRQIRN